RTRARPSAGLGTGTRACFAGDGGRDADLSCLTGKCLFELDLHVVFQVGATLASRAPAAPTTHAEEIVEDVGECRGELGAETMRPAAAGVFESGVAEAIVGGALVAVLEHVIGLVELLEAMLAFLVARIAVRMVLHGELAECGLELRVGSGTRYPQDLVVVAFGHSPSLHPVDVRLDSRGSL